MKYTMENLKQNVKKLEKCARRTVAKAKRFALCKPKRLQRQSPTNDVTPKQHSPLSRPETYVPTGAPWIKTSSDSKHSRVTSEEHISTEAGTMPPSENESQAPILTQTIEEHTEEHYTTGLPRMAMALCGTEKCIALLPSLELAGQLKQAVLEHRAVNKAEETFATRLGDLDNALNNICLDIEEADDEIAELEHEDAEDSQRRVAKLRRRLARLQRKREKAIEARQTCIQALDVITREQRHHVYMLLAAFEEVLVGSNIIRPENEEATDSDDENPVNMRGVRSLLASSEASSVSDLDDGGAGDELFPDGPFGIAAQEDHRQQMLETERLIRVFHSMRTRLHVMEDVLDNRDTSFDKQADDRDRRLRAGEEVESSLAFDMLQLEATRRMTRQVIDAEEALEAAKDAAVAAGVQVPGSEISSGFVDDVGDGYRISLERACAASVDQSRVLKWMSGVLAEDADEAYEVERDDWDARSVDICDSWSMVAEGPERRRIDKWSGICYGR